MIDRITVDKILDAANIVDVVSDFVALKRAGSNLKGLCPFHDDRTPSFMVSPARNYCKCFACGEGGSPVGFIMKHEQLSYPDALRYLAKKYGIKIEEKELTQEEIQSRGDRESMFILNEWARDWFKKELWETPDGKAIGLAYFRGRGFRDDILEKFQVGFCPDSRKHSLSADALKEGYQERYLVNNANEMEPRLSIGTGLSIKKDKGDLRDRFYGRVIWPIYTASGRVAGFGGRVLDAATKGVAVKYLNSPESIIYSKRKELFGLFQARQAIRKADLCYLVEGYTDVMAMHQQGVENVVASSGTALTPEQIRLIHRITNNITVIFDGDDAGIHASERGIDMLLAEGMNVKLLLLPDGDDPDSFAQKHTATEYQQYLQENQVDFITYKATHAIGAKKGDPDAEERLIHNVAESIAVIPDEIKRTIYIRHAAQQLNMPERLIDAAVRTQMGKLNEEKQKELERAQREAQDQPQTQDFPHVSDEKESISTPHPLTFPSKETGEASLAQMIIRHGEKVMCYIEDENKQEVPLSVAEYISLSLQDDNISLQSSLCQMLLQEAVENAHKPNFHAEQYFISHPDPDIRALALKLGPDSVELSRIYDEKTFIIGADKEEKETQNEEEKPADLHLDDVVPRLVASYKLNIVQKELKDIIELMKRSEVKEDKERSRQLLEDYKNKSLLAKELAKECGARVVLK
ncbi:MAG: DNA primase [Bacteroidaceae bacterium]|nr:DNA primase [Bacteroidaceae bacterium]